ncbi:MAG TPA: nucleotidyltransferase domain-containing protein [Chitinophagaceae bacterium]|nr:nucleotidyltransferase domain-containing protein [Chitinophagaceae bacterium]
MDKSLVRAFAEKTGIQLTELLNAENLTLHNYYQIKEKLGAIRLFSSDVDLVVFGSIARNECTIGSDVDWTLLIDGSKR